MKGNWKKTRPVTRIFVAFCMVFSFVPMASGAAFADDTVENPYVEGSYVEGEMLVVFNTTSSETAMRALSVIDVTDEDNLPDQGAVEDAVEDSTPVLVELEDGVSVAEAVAEANENPAIAYAQPNYIYTLPANEDVYTVEVYGVASLTTSNAADELEEYLHPCFVPNDPAVQKTTPSSYSANAWQLANIGAFDAWETAKTNDAVTVCVMDTGCLMTHEDLEDRVWTEYAYNAYTSSKLTKDYNGHGTHVAGCVAATANNGVGTAGASYNAKVLPICVFDTAGVYCYTSTLVAAYDYMLTLMDAHPELNIRVANMSLGGYGSKGSEDVLLEKAVAKAKEKGVVTCAAGGNGDDKGNPYTEASYPSDYENVVSVTALSSDGVSPVSWCDYNSSKDICAPGDNIYSTYKSSTSSYKMMSGTSMSAPIVSGCFALLFAANPNLTPDEAEAAIKSTAKPLEVESGREGLYGAGIIDLAAALEEVVAAPSISLQPQDASALAGGKVTMSVSARGDVASYQWQHSKDGVTWNNTKWTGYDTNELSFKMLAALDGRQWRCIVTFEDGTELTSDAATTTLLDHSGQITVQPTSVFAFAGQTATMVVTAEGVAQGVEVASYQWQHSKDGEKWSNTKWDGYDTCELDFEMLTALADRQWRCIVTFTDGTSITSDAATSYLRAQPAVIPAETTAAAGEDVGLSVLPIDDATYQWQHSRDGITWSNTKWTGYDDNNFSFKMLTALDGRQWRCKITLDDDFVVYSTVATTKLAE